MSHFKGIFENRQEAINKAICGGLVNYGDNIKVDRETALKTCLIEFLQGNEVFGSLRDLFLKNGVDDIDNGDIIIDGKIDLDLFHDYFFNFSIPESLEPDFIECAKIILAMKNLNITGNPESIYHVGKSLSTGKIFVGIKPETLYQFRDENKAEFDVMQFMLYAALKSIIGTKKAIKTNKAFVFNRMFDSPTDKEKMVIQKYNTRRKWDKLIEFLETNWGLKYYSRYTRGFYFSFRMNLKDLIKIAEEKRPSNLSKNHKSKKKEILKQALKELKNDN